MINQIWIRDPETDEESGWSTEWRLALHEHMNDAGAQLRARHVQEDHPFSDVRIVPEGERPQS